MKCDKTLHGHQRVSSRLPLTGVRGAQGQWACACPRGEDSISTDTYGQTVVCLRRQLAMISSATPATARNAKGILTEYLCGKNTFDSATLVYFVLFVNTFECSTFCFFFVLDSFIQASATPYRQAAVRPAAGLFCYQITTARAGRPARVPVARTGCSFPSYLFCCF